MIALLGLLVAAGLAPAADEFRALFDPQVSYVPLDSLVTVAFAVDDGARAFNGYELTLDFDATRLDLLAVEEGELMVDGCDARYVDVDTTLEGSVTYTHVLLCAGTTVDGPGELCRLVFRATDLGYAELTPTSDPLCTFFQFGACVNPDHPTDPREVVLLGGEVRVYDPVLTSDDLPIGGPTSVIPRPIPAIGGRGRLTVAAGGDVPVRASLHDVAGRRVWSWEGQAPSSGRLDLDWEVAGASSGVLFYVVTTGGTRHAGRIPVLR